MSGNTTVSRILQSGSSPTVIAAELARFRRNMTVLFTDIKGSTAYFSRFGDTAGLMMVHQCNELVGEIVQKHGGWVVKTIGDSVMAVFEDCRKGVTAAVQMQRSLAAKNARAQPAERVFVRIGLNYGLGIVRSNDVFGDVVNVASRVESVASAEQIVISDTVKEELGDTSDFKLRYLGQFVLKGKSEDRALFELDWNQQRPLPPTPAHGMLTVFRKSPQPPQFKLRHLARDGKVSAEYDLADRALSIGRREATLKFPDDAKMEPHHAQITVESGQVFVEPIGNAAVFFTTVGTYTLQDGDVVKMGDHLFQFSARTEALKRAAAIGTCIRDLATQLASPVAEFVSLGLSDEHFSLDREEVTWGRSQATYTFPEDVLMSRAHAKVYHRGEDFFLEDLESRNGTFLKARSKVPVPAGTRMLIGGQLLQLACIR
jgi:class 3 adenylate cyclase/pSer/pThr/pTyr-binding forkhead associated (FHA) protein